MRRLRTPRRHVRVVALVAPARVLGELIQLITRRLAFSRMCRRRPGRGCVVSVLLGRGVRGVRRCWRAVVLALSLGWRGRVVTGGPWGPREVRRLGRLFRGEPGSAKEGGGAGAASASRTENSRVFVSGKFFRRKWLWLGWGKGRTCTSRIAGRNRRSRRRGRPSGPSRANGCCDHKTSCRHHCNRRLPSAGLRCCLVGLSRRIGSTAEGEVDDYGERSV
jgi:hypothetical protein